MPALFLRIFGNALVQTMIIPTHGQQDSLVAFWHRAKEYQPSGLYQPFGFDCNVSFSMVGTPHSEP
jgi:hypothetical protein